MVTNVRISPDTTPTLNILNALGDERMRMDQMKLAEAARQKAQFQDLISKSYQSVSSQWQPEYANKQNEFIKQASDIYKKSGGFLSMEDHMKLKSLQQPLEEYVAYANAGQKLYSDLAEKIQLADANKVNKQMSLLNLKNVMELRPGDTPQTLYNRLNSSGIVVDKYKDNWIEKAKAFSDVSTESATESDISESTVTLPNGNTLITTGKFNEDKYDQNVENDWTQNESSYLANGLSKEDHKQIFSGLKDSYIKPIMNRKTRSGGSGPDKTKTVEISPDYSGKYPLEPFKKQMKVTFENGMTGYDKSGAKINTTYAVNGEIVSFKEMNWRGANELFAGIKVPVSQSGDDAMLWTEVQFQKDENGKLVPLPKKPKENVDVVYYPVSQLSENILESAGINLKGYDMNKLKAAFEREKNANQLNNW